jgi:hypothetical protein
LPLVEQDDHLPGAVSVCSNTNWLHQGPASLIDTVQPLVGDGTLRMTAFGVGVGVVCVGGWGGGNSHSRG